MKKIFLFLLAFLLVQCISIKKHNETINTKIEVVKLHKDVDFAYKKLQKLQPQLYQYISKETLDFKFDSLKTTITKPLNSYEFYTKISPVIAEVRQGHLLVSPKTYKYSKKEIKKRKGKINPFKKIDFEIFENNVYVVKNRSNNTEIKIGDQLVAINDVAIDDLVRESNNKITSDGYNLTFKNKMMTAFLGNLYTYKTQNKDSVLFKFANDKQYWVNYKGASKKADTITSKIKYTKIQKDSIKEKAKELRKRNSKYGYDALTKTDTRNLYFTENDSCTAVIKIKGFKNGNYWGFYKETFETLKNAQTKNLIIDLRDNFGGRLAEINELYSYLVDTSYVFINPSQVTKKTSLVYADYFKGSSKVGYVLKGLVSPIYYGFMYFSVHKDANDNYIYHSNSKVTKNKENYFDGKIYVLINGGSFSASSILSTKLKGTNRATFVGEETGGDYNGTVAGRMPVYTLPNSKVNLRIGLMYVNGIEKTDTKGRGIFPDVTIIPTIEDRINNNDPEMNYILKTIEENKTNEITVTADK